MSSVHRYSQYCTHPRTLHYFQGIDKINHSVLKFCERSYLIKTVYIVQVQCRNLIMFALLKLLVLYLIEWSK